MEEILDKFNELVQQMANAVAEAKDEKEAEKLQDKWDKDIEKAEAEMQEQLEEFIKAQDDALLAEQKASEEEIKALEKEVEDSFNDTSEEEENAQITEDNHPLLNIFKKLVKLEEDAKSISKRFRESELIEMGKEFGFEWTTKGTKIEKVILLKTKL
jgi:predicted phage gp36 major capsid-like protein